MDLTIEHPRVSHPIYNLLPTEIEGFDSLAELALDMRWSWNHATDEVWRQLDSELWEITHNPWVVLQTVSRDRIEKQHLFDPQALTLGFARRFATYKRPNLLLRDPERLLRLLTNPEHPVQLILAGKAHPEDQAGQALIREWTSFIQRPGARQHVIFLSDYDMLLTEQLVQGVDVWINTPRRPWEASGTSGMKVLVNGGINLSELDGWWAEAYTPEVGWAVGDGREHGDDLAWDSIEAEALYNLLEREVIPEFYTRDDRGIPVAWIERMRESMARLTPHFSANRAVRGEYTEQHYLAAAAAYRERAANKGAGGRKIVDWQYALERQWSTLHILEIQVKSNVEAHAFESFAVPGDVDAGSSGERTSGSRDYRRFRATGGGKVWGSGQVLY